MTDQGSERGAPCLGRFLCHAHKYQGFRQLSTKVENYVQHTIYFDFWEVYIHEI
jgi:hypothetical protein